VSEARRPRASRQENSGDPLGKLLRQYRVSLAGVVVMAGAVALVGLGVLAVGLARKPVSPTFLLMGTVALLMAFALVGINLFNVGRRLELRKHGIRYMEAGVETELAWDEIAEVEVSRLDRTNFGVATVWKRSADASRPSGLFTNTEFTVIIHARDGRRIRLSPIFLRGVADPRKLIAELRLRSGLD
jgi:hypothetical protein